MRDASSAILYIGKAIDLAKDLKPLAPKAGDKVNDSAKNMDAAEKNLNKQENQPGAKNADQAAKDLEAARQEIARSAEYDYIIVNSDINQTVESLDAILRAERLRRNRPPPAP